MKENVWHREQTRHIMLRNSLLKKKLCSRYHVFVFDFNVVSFFRLNTKSCITIEQKKRGYEVNQREERTM